MPRKHDEDLFKKTTMTFGEHLEELRICLFKALAGLMVGFIIGLYFGGDVVAWIEMPLRDALKTYHQKETLDWLDDLQADGHLPPGDAARFEDLVLEDELLAKDVYLELDAVLDELKRVRPTLQITNVEGAEGGHGDAKSAKAGDDPAEETSDEALKKVRKTDLLRLFVWSPVEEKIQDQVADVKVAGFFRYFLF